MRHLFFFILLSLLCIAPAAADDQTEVSKLLQEKIDAVVLLLQDKAMDKKDRNTQIINIVSPIFNYQTMAKLSLGKKYWPELSSEKQTEFSNLFAQRIQESYLEKLDIYTDEKVVYGQPQAVGKQIHMPTTLVAKDSKIEILYKFYHSGSSWEIYDVEIGGVSVIQTYRSQFDGVLSEGTIDDLLAKLKTQGAFQIPESGEAGG